MRKLSILLIALAVISCSKSKDTYNLVDGKWQLDRIVNNQTTLTFIYLQDSIYYYDILNGVAKIYLHHNGKDSLMYVRKIDPNYIFFKYENSFQYGYPWDYNLFKRR